MIVEFECFNICMKEDYEKDLHAELHGNASVPFCNQNDYVATYAMDITEVTGYFTSKVWFNDKEMMGTKVFHNKSITPFLNISTKDFKKVLEVAKGIKILNHREL